MATICPKRGFIGKFHLNDFHLIIVPYHAAKLEKNLLHRSCDISWCNFRPQLGQNFPFGPKEDFWETFTLMIFLYLLCPIILQKLKEKKILEWILWYKLIKFWATILPKLPIWYIKGNFSLNFFIYLLWSVMLKTFKNILSMDPEI